MTGVAVHPGALGDVLLAIPALRALRAAGPARRLAVAAQPRIAALLVSLGVADAAHDFESLGLGRFFAEEAAVAPPLLAHAARVICWFGARDPDFVRRFRAAVPGAVVAPPAGDGLVWRHLLASVGGDAETVRAPVIPPAELVAAGRALLLDAGWDGRAAVLLVHPGAGGLVKRWPAAGFAAALAPALARGDLFVALHRGPADADAVAALAPRLPRRVPIVADPPLPARAGALALATAYLGNDSGVSHLAAAVGTRAVVLFRAAASAWQPWGPRAEAITVSTAAVEAGDVARVTAALAACLPGAAR